MATKNPKVILDNIVKDGEVKDVMLLRNAAVAFARLTVKRQCLRRLQVARPRLAHALGHHGQQGPQPGRAQDAPRESKSPDAQEGIWSKIGLTYEQWLRSFVRIDEDEDGIDGSLRQEEKAKSAKSTYDPAMSDSQVYIVRAPAMYFMSCGHVVQALWDTCILGRFCLPWLWGQFVVRGSCRH